MISFFEEMRGSDMAVLEKELKSCNISKLDIRRMYRYLDKNVKRDSIMIVDDVLLSDDELE